LYHIHYLKYRKKLRNIQTFAKIQKKKPKKIVIKKASIAWKKEPIAIPRCAQVMDKPEIINKAVLNKGNSKTGISVIPTGGQS